MYNVITWFQLTMSNNRKVRGNSTHELFYNNIVALTTYAVSPREERNTEHGVRYTESVSYALEDCHHLPGYQIDRQHSSQESEKCKSLQLICRRPLWTSSCMRAQRIRKLGANGEKVEKVLTLWNFGTRSTWVIRNTITPITVPTTRNIGTTETGPKCVFQTTERGWKWDGSRDSWPKIFLTTNES